jgi:hypothetical protein
VGVSACRRGFPSHDCSWFGFIESDICIFPLDLIKSKSNAKTGFVKQPIDFDKNFLQMEFMRKGKNEHLLS